MRIVTAASRKSASTVCPSLLQHRGQRQRVQILRHHAMRSAFARQMSLVTFIHTEIALILVKYLPLRSEQRRKDDSGTSPSQWPPLMVTHKWELLYLPTHTALPCHLILLDFLEEEEEEKKNTGSISLRGIDQWVHKHWNVAFDQSDFLWLLTSVLELLSWACISHPCTLCSRRSISCGWLIVNRHVNQYHKHNKWAT